MTGALGVGEPLQQQHAGTLGEAGAVGLFGEGLAVAIGGQAVLPGEFGEDLGRGHDGHPAGQRQRALVAA